MQVIQKFDGEMAAKTQQLIEKNCAELADIKAQHEIALSEVCIHWSNACMAAQAG